MSKNAKFLGFIGVCCLQASSIPAIVQALHTGETAPVASIILVMLGLIACMIQEIYVKLWAYVVGSAIGVAGQLALLIVILVR